MGTYRKLYKRETLYGFASLELRQTDMQYLPAFREYLSKDCVGCILREVLDVESSLVDVGFVDDVEIEAVPSAELGLGLVQR